MGHEEITIGDVITDVNIFRFDILHPMEWDTFGLPFENVKQNNSH